MSRWRPILVTFALVLVSLTLVPGRARADMDIGFVENGETPAVPDGSDTEYAWYGYKGLGLDATAALVLAGGLADSPLQKPLLLAGVGLFVVGTPALHFARGHEGRGVTSLIVRATVPVGIGLLTAYGQGCGTSRRDGQCDGGEYIMPFVAGGLAAIGIAVVDDLMFSWEAKEKPRAPTWTPTVAPSPAGGMTLGVVGTF